MRNLATLVSVPNLRELCHELLLDGLAVLELGPVNGVGLIGGLEMRHDTCDKACPHKNR